MPDSDYDFGDNNEQDHDGVKVTAPYPSMTAAPKESGSESHSQYGSESHSQHTSTSYSQYGSESHSHNGSESQLQYGSKPHTYSHYGSGSHSHNGSESHTHTHSQYGSVPHKDDKHKKYKATTLSTHSKHWGNATAYPIKSHSVTTTTTAYPTKSHSVTTITTATAITTPAELYSSMPTPTPTPTPAETSMVFTGGLKDPTLDRPCFDSSCKNPDSNMNYVVTIPIGGSEPGAGNADNSGGDHETFKGGAAGRVELAMGMGVWGALVAAGIAVAVVGL